MNSPKTHCGYIALIGQPNVGKSTLLNRILGQKISITSSKPQTTRHRILGIHTSGDTQFIFVDTPGIHRDYSRAINRYMNKTVRQTVSGVDVILFITDARRFTSEDETILKSLQHAECPVIWVLNKVDEVGLHERCLALVAKIQPQFQFADIIPISAQNGDNIEKLQTLIAKYLPENAFYYDSEQITDRSERFLLAEMIREKIFRYTGSELPYFATVDIEHFELKNSIYMISAVIYVEREGQKKIIIGEQGNKLKQVGKSARLDMEKMLGKKVFLQLWVKVKAGWSDDESLLPSLGYSD